MTLLDRAKELIALVPKEGEYVNAPIAAQYARAVVELAEALRPFAIHDDISGENTLLAVSPTDMRRVRAALQKLEEK